MSVVLSEERQGRLDIMRRYNPVAQIHAYRPLIIPKESSSHLILPLKGL